MLPNFHKNVSAKHGIQGCTHGLALLTYTVQYKKKACLNIISLQKAISLQNTGVFSCDFDENHCSSPS